MPAQLEEITAVYLSERFRFANADGDVIIADAHANSTINGPITIKGPADLDELKPHQTYRFYGRWSSYKNKRTGVEEKQFHFDTFTFAAPHNREGIVAYLKQAGEGHYFGIARASALWDTFGADAVRVIRETPEQAVAALVGKGLPLALEAATLIAKKLTDQQSLENCTIELTELMAGRGFGKSIIRKMIQDWGNRANAIARRDPYKLMRFRNAGFKKCDAMYMSLGLPPGRLKRQALSAWYALASNSDGHTWFAMAVAWMGIKSGVGGADLKIEKAMSLAKRAGAIAELETKGVNGPIVNDGTCAWAAEGSKARNEGQLATMIADAMQEPFAWPEVASVPNLSDHQREQLAKSLSGPIAILGGSPGTGKTYTAANLIGLLMRVLGQGAIGIAAPTGKAAVRLTEALAGYGIALRARTWHSLLGVESREDRGGWGFAHNAANPLQFKVLIGDETSMNDCDLMASIFRARAKGTLVLLIGDVNQLPPVGHGAPLRDMIAAGLPYGELREIKRNNGGIVEACAAIRDSQRWTVGDNLQVIETVGPNDQVANVMAQLREAKNAGLDPVWDCQVLAAVNAKSPLSRKELNKILQTELNKNPGQQGQPFRLGDKIVNTKNGYFPLTDGGTAGDEETQINDRGEVYVANGELAEVVEVAEKYTVAKLSSPARVIKIPRGKATEAGDGDEPVDEEKTATGCSWDLGYCLSTHKSQGSEWPWVIVLGDEYPGAKRVCSREWLYTAISRAKQRCVLVGKKSTFDGYCRRVALGQRKTLLKERILLEQAKLELATL